MQNTGETAKNGRMPDEEKMQQYTIGDEESKKEESVKKAQPGGAEPTMSIKRQSADAAQPDASKKFRWNAEAAEWGGSGMEQ